MKKLLIALFMTAIMAVSVTAQFAGVDYIETPVTNYIASVTTNRANTAIAVVPALDTGAGLYSYIKLTPAAGTAYIGFGSTNGMSTNATVTTNGWSWSLPAGGVNGGPYRNSAIYLMNSAGDTSIVSVAVETWKVKKQR